MVDAHIKQEKKSHKNSASDNYYSTQSKYRARKEHNRSPLEFIYMHKLIVS